MILEEKQPKRPLLRVSLMVLVGAALLALGAWLAWTGVLDSGPSAEEHFTRADGFHRRGNLRAAVVELKNTLQKQPDHADARWMLAQIHLHFGDGASAMKEIEYAELAGRRGPEVRHAKWQAMVLQREFEAVIKDILRYSIEETDPATLVVLGQARLGLGELPSASYAFRLALQQDAEQVEARLGLAEVALRQGELTKAQEHLDSVFNLSGDGVQAWLLKGELELSRSDFEAAQRAYETALKFDGRNSAVTVGLARALLGQDRAEEAAELLEPLSRIHPRDPRVNYLRAVLADRQGDRLAAKNALREVLGMTPSHTRSLLLLSAIHYRDGDFQQAVDSLSIVLESHPEHALAIKLMAAAHLQLRKPDRALEALRPLLKRAAADPQLLVLLGNVHLQQGQPTKGIEFLEKAQSLAPDAAALRAQLARGYLAAGEIDLGITTLQAATELDPAYTEADEMLVLFHLRQQDHDAALEAATKLAEKQPDDPLPAYLTGFVHEAKGQIHEARASFERALEIDSSYEPGALALAQLELRAHDREAARNRYQALLEKDPNQLQALIGLAQLAGERGRIEEGRKLLKQAREHHPNALEPRLMLAAYYLDTGIPEEALMIAREAYDIAPTNPRVALGLGRVQLAAGRRKEALTTLSTLAKEHPDLASAHLHLALARAAAGDTAGAHSSLEKTLELDSDNLRAKVTLGNLALRSGRLDDALVWAARIRAEHPNGPDSYALTGDVLMAQHNYLQASKAYQKALLRRASSALAMRLSGAHRAMGDLTIAREVLRKWLSRRPGDSEVRHALAAFQRDVKQPHAAIEEYQRLLELDPDNVVALTELAELYHEQKDPRALETARQAYELAPSRPEVMTTYGWLLINTGHLERGLLLLRQAVKAAPNSVEARYHLALSLDLAKEYDEALHQVEWLLESGQPVPDEARLQELLPLLKGGAEAN